MFILLPLVDLLTILSMYYNYSVHEVTYEL